MKLYWDWDVLHSEKFRGNLQNENVISDLNVHITIYNNDLFKQSIIVTSGE